jgi:hypothetical protein
VNIGGNGFAGVADQIGSMTYRAGLASRRRVDQNLVSSLALEQLEREVHPANPEVGDPHRRRPLAVEESVSPPRRQSRRLPEDVADAGDERRGCGTSTSHRPDASVAFDLGSS